MLKKSLQHAQVPLCTHIRDCHDGSDEGNCTESHCEGKEWNFACNDEHGTCVFQTWTCDGEADCPNGADEVNCSEANRTAAGEVDGLTTRLPPPVFPTKDCEDHYMFQCHNGEQCIPYWWKCDQSRDCSDGSDEVSPLLFLSCSTTTTVKIKLFV